MEVQPPNFANLMRQLGLANDGQCLDDFVRANRLPPGVALADAAFWSPSQAAFLRDALALDATWSITVDQLASRLS